MIGSCICVETYWMSGFAVYEKDKKYSYTNKHFTTREFPEGYNVKFSKGEYLFFRKYQDPLAENGYGLFSTYFKTIKDIRTEKLNKLEE